MTAPEGQAKSATELLEAAASHMRARAVTYDSPQGERSMAATVAAFNAITGKRLSEHEGWLMMMCLKMVRGQQSPVPHPDSAEDLVAYASLFAEARMGGR